MWASVAHFTVAELYLLVAHTYSSMHTAVLLAYAIEFNWHTMCMKIRGSVVSLSVILSPSAGGFFKYNNNNKCCTVVRGAYL